MVKRRRLWGRTILVYVCLLLVMFYGGLMLSINILSNPEIFMGRFMDEMSDTLPPVIETKGGDSLTLAIGDILDDPGINAYDDSSIPEVRIESNVDVSKEGEYTIKYTATDSAGNETTSNRLVKIVRPNGRIYLTFDDGPSEYTGALLDLLKRYGIKATFFVTGYGDDALIRREHSEGHTVGLHTMSHNYGYIYSSVESYWSDFNAIQDRVQQITGEHSSLIRFPGGSSNLISAVYDGGQKIMSLLVTQVTERGYHYFDWNVDSNDAGGAESADEVFTNVVTAMQPGGEYVVLQHDVKPYSVEAVEKIIQYGLDNGFVFSKLRVGSYEAHHSVNN